LQKKGYTIGKFPAKVSQQHLYKNYQVNIFKYSLKMLLCLFQFEAVKTITALGDYQSTSAHD
jgi:hypothetical protein